MATVSARTPLECLVIRRSDLRTCIAEAPELGWLLLQTVALRLSNVKPTAPGQPDDSSPAQRRWRTMDAATRPEGCACH